MRPSTAVAASAVNPSWNTESQARARCSSAVSRSQDQAITAVRVWCRAGADRSRLRSRAKRSSSARRTSSTDIVRTRAAASSTASGSPSSRSTISSTTASGRSASGRTAWARRRNSSAPSLGASWPSGKTRSAAMPSGARLVVTTRRSRVVTRR